MYLINQRLEHDMAKDEWEERFEVECKISDRVVKLLKLKPMKYSYPKIENPDDCYPDHTKTYKMQISICVSKFFDGLDAKSDIEAALQRIAIEGICEFKWPVGRHYNSNRHMHLVLTNPTWADVFRAANEAFLDGCSVDHHFLEGFDKDIHSGKYEFHFGS